MRSKTIVLAQPSGRIAVDEIRLFSSLSKTVKRRLSKEISWQSFDAGSTIISRGEDGDSVFFLGSGTARVVNYSEIGRIVSLATLTPGDCFGELSAIDGLTRSATVVAISECLVGSIKGQDFIAAVTRCHKTALALLQRLATIIRITDTRIENLSLMTAEQRVCFELLSNLRADPKKKYRFYIDPVQTQTELASMTGTTQNTVARIFSKLYEAGAIARKGKALNVLNPGHLEKIVLSEKST